MKKSEILQHARSMIERKTKDTVCSALIGIVKLTPGCHVQVAELRQWVKNLLGGAQFYECWIHAHHSDYAITHCIPYSLFDRDGQIPDIFNPARPGRLQWMDWMISYWEKQEADEHHRLYGYALAG